MGPGTYLRGSSPNPSVSGAGVVDAGGGVAGAAAYEPAGPWGPLCLARDLYQ